MTNDEFGMSNWLNFVIRTSAFALPSAIAVMHEKHGIACDMLHGLTWDKWTSGTPTERLQLIPAGQEHGKKDEG